MSSLPDQLQTALASQGTVFRKSQGHYFVRDGQRTVQCAISNRLRKELVYPIAAPTSLRHRVREVKAIGTVDPVAVGDRVQFTDGGHDTGVITEVLPRRSALARPAAGSKPLEHVLVANVDQVVAVFAVAQPSPKWELLDRYIAAAEAAGVRTLVAVTKLDLGLAEAHAADLRDFERLGYPVLLTSTLTGQGLDDLRASLRGRLSVFVGKSGVGKTSLLNALEPCLGLRVKSVSAATTKGRHTTSHVEMFDLALGGQVVDTPGMREFGLWKLDEAGLAHAFVEFRPYLGRCKFSADCLHDHEPGCAIKAAVQAGAISARRYHSYLRMLAD